MKMIGILHSSSFSRACNCRPDIFGIRISTIRHAARVCKSDSRNSSAEPKHRATSPAASSRSRSESCIALSSSTIAINLDVRSIDMWPAYRRRFTWSNQTLGCLNQTLEIRPSLAFRRGKHRVLLSAVQDPVSNKSDALLTVTGLLSVADKVDLHSVFLSSQSQSFTDSSSNQ